MRSSIRPLLWMLLVFALVIVATAVGAQTPTPAGPVTDWKVLLTPLIIAAVPVIVIVVKRFIPAKWSVAYPLAAAALGPALDWLVGYLADQSVGARWGVVLGLAGVGLREIVDQLRKFPMPTAK